MAAAGWLIYMYICMYTILHFTVDVECWAAPLLNIICTSVCCQLMLTHRAARRSSSTVKCRIVKISCTDCAMQCTATQDAAHVCLDVSHQVCSAESHIPHFSRVVQETAARVLMLLLRKLPLCNCSMCVCCSVT